MKRTPLYDEHVALGARIVEFGGWEMPVWYEGIPAEHQAVRRDVGLFDVSHMGEFVVQGPGALDYLQRVLTNNVAELAIGQAHYTLLPNAEGGTVDDLLVYRTGPDDYLLVVNAGNIQKDLAWLQSQLPSGHAGGDGVRLEDQSDRFALLALQGPRALAVLGALTPLALMEMPYYHFQNASVAGLAAMISRTGYTGEDGFEIMVAAEDAVACWRALLAAGSAHPVRPVGLGARDSLRLEAAMPLYGNELDDATSVLEAGLGRFVDLTKQELNGLARFQSEAAGGVRRKLVGLALTERGIPRQGYRIMDGEAAGTQVGTITSGTLSPTLDIPIGMGYVSAAYAKVGTELAVEVRGRTVPAKVVRRPFYRRAAK